MENENYEIWFDGKLLLEAETLDIALREAFDASGENGYQAVHISKGSECIAIVTKSEE